MLREATSADVELIRGWRDHPKVRDMSIWTDPITPEGHARWWEATQADVRRRVLIFEYLGVPCGVVTINDHDVAARTAEWGFFLDVDGLDSRRELLPAWIALEKAAITYAFDVMGLVEIGGRTLARNRPVLDLHRRFGFVEDPDRSYVVEIEGRPRRVVWTTMTFDRRSVSR